MDEWQLAMAHGIHHDHGGHPLQQEDTAAADAAKPAQE